MLHWIRHCNYWMKILKKCYIRKNSNKKLKAVIKTNNYLQILLGKKIENLSEEIEVINTEQTEIKE